MHDKQIFNIYFTGVLCNVTGGLHDDNRYNCVLKYKQWEKIIPEMYNSNRKLYTKWHATAATQYAGWLYSPHDKVLHTLCNKLVAITFLLCFIICAIKTTWQVYDFKYLFTKLVNTAVASCTGCIMI
jgi:hypothetical protein